MHNPALRLNLKGMLNKDVMIKIRVYKVYLSGKLIAFDQYSQYSNILLENAVEYKLNEEGVKEEICKYSGNVLLRGDSIIALTIEK
ncbi:MAG: LSM domain-containing protein [Promethearchaeota archaeon]